MSTSFDRNRGQLRCESIFNCNSLEDWQQADFKNFTLNQAHAVLLTNDLLDDSKDFYFKGLLSFFESLDSIKRNLFSWATVKIYYSVYYFLRSSLALNGVAMIRQKSLFYLKSLNGESPVSRSNKKYNSDHSGTINHFIDLFSSDILLSQSIASTNVYDWIMNKREQINYRERTFNEPHHSDFWNDISNEINRGNFENLLNQYISDRYILCFQEEHAILAIPLKRALLTKQQLDQEGIAVSINSDKIKVLEDLLPFQNSTLKSLML